MGIRIHLLCILFIVPVITAQTAIQLTPSLQQALVDKHNNYRKNAGSSNMRFLTWSEFYATSAGEYAMQCEYPTYSNNASYGENMYASTVSSIDSNVEAVTEAWYNEFQNYDYDTQTCNSTCRNYIQIVFANTYKFGCGASTCPGKAGLLGGSAFILIVCHYWELTDLDNLTSLFEKGAPCTECASPDDYCHENLCANLERDGIDFRLDNITTTSVTIEKTTPIPVSTTSENANSTAATQSSTTTTTTTTTTIGTTTLPTTIATSPTTEEITSSTSSSSTTLEIRHSSTSPTSSPTTTSSVDPPSSSTSSTTTSEAATTTTSTEPANPCGIGGFSNGRRFLFNEKLCVQYYYECVHNNYIKRPCAAGTKFDVDSTTCTWERNIAACQDDQPTVSSFITTEESFTTSTLTASNPCDAGGFANGRRFLFDVTSCVQYYFECVHDNYIQRQCAAGTKFDVESTTCNWERNIAACQDEEPTVSSSSTTTATSDSTTANPCGVGGFPNGRRFLFDVTSCVQYYYECVHDNYIQRQCAAGTKFDVESTTCTWERDITACQDEQTTVSVTDPHSSTTTATSAPTTSTTEYTTETEEPLTTSPPLDLESCTEAQRQYVTMFRKWQQEMDDWSTSIDEYVPCP
ncbi:uncharacterized protein LOC120337855 isoform X1 [Styela clava]